MKISLSKYLKIINKIFIFLAVVGSNAILIFNIPLYLYYRISFFIFIFIIVNVLFIAGNKISFKMTRILEMNILFLIFLIFFSFISIFWTPNLELSLRYSMLLSSQILLSIIIIFITKENIIEYIDFLIYIFIFSGIIAYLQIFNILKFRIAYTYEFENIGAFSLFGFNEFSYIITIFYPLLIIYFPHRNRVIAFCNALSIPILLLFTGSILGFFSISLEFILVISMAKKIRNAKVIKTLILFSFLLLLICIININYILYLADKYTISIRVVSQFLTQLQFYSQNGDPFSYRLDLLRFSLSLIAKSYLLGIGAGGDSFYIMNAGLPGNTHNWLLEVFVNFGIFIFILYIFIIVDLLYRLKKIFSASNLSYEIRSIALALFLGLIIIPINGMIVSSLIKVNFFWIFYGIVVAFCDKYFYEQGNIKYV